MTHNCVYDIFEKKFNKIAGQIEVWFPNGKNSIRIRLDDKNEYIFTFNSESDWSLETVNSYLKRVKGESKKRA